MIIYGMGVGFKRENKYIKAEKAEKMWYFLLLELSIHVFCFSVGF